MSKKKPLSPELFEECAAAHRIFIAKRNELKLSQKKIADAAGISAPGVNLYFKGINALNLPFATVLSRELQTPIESFSPRLAAEAAAVAGAFKESHQKIEPNAELIGMMSAWDSDTPLRDDEVAIPLYKEVEMAAGNGASTEVIEAPGRLLRFAKSTLREAGVMECNAACATVTGRSMERLIMDGATIGIDRGTTDIIDGEIYAYDHDGMLRVKYLYNLPGGGLRVRSENSEEYPDETITPEQLSHVRILGWVFWWSTIRRRNGARLDR